MCDTGGADEPSDCTETPRPHARRLAVMIPQLSCYRCGASLNELSLPLARLDECPHCRVQLHVCRMCEHYDPRAPDGCSEDDAPEVREKERANFCDYFKPSPYAHAATGAEAAQRAEAELRALFGDGEAEAAGLGTPPHRVDDALRRAEALFKK